MIWSHEILELKDCVCGRRSTVRLFQRLLDFLIGGLREGIIVLPDSLEIRIHDQGVELVASPDNPRCART